MGENPVLLSLSEVAIAWTLRSTAVTAAIVGIRSAQQAKGISGAADLDLTQDEIAEIEDRLVPSPAHCL